MPREYEQIRNSLESRGKGEKAAKSEAAAIYNSRHHDHPVTGHSETPEPRHEKRRPSHT